MIPADEYEVAYKDNVNAGEATVTVTSKEDSNYFFEEKDANYTINPKGITITDATVAPKTYNGTNNAVVTIDPETGITGIIATDLDKVVVTPKDATFEDANAGTDKVVTVGEYTLTGEAAKNYTIAETPTLKGDIDKAVVTVSGITVADKDYDGSTTANVNTDDMVIGGVLDGEDVKVQVAGAFEDKNAGDDKNVKVTYTLGGDDAANYQLASATSDETASINKKEVGLTWPTELSFPYDGLEHGISATLSGVVTGEDVEISSTKDNVKIETGTYTAVVEGLKGDDADNYVLPTDKSKVWSIGKVTVPATDYTITIKEPEGGYTYDGTAKEPIVEVKIGDEVIPTNEYTFSYKDNVNAGEAKVVISAKENSNYVFEEKDAPFTINKATITVNEPVVANKVYNGLDVAEVTYTISGVVTGDDVKVGYTANFDDKNAGTQKPVTVNYTLSGDDVANYQLATTTETLKGDITPKEVNLVWNYTDPFTYDGTDKTVTVERIEGVLEGDEVAVSSYADNVKKEVGDYKAKASGIDNTNYVISSTSAEKDWSIVPENGAITIEFVDDDYVYTYNGEEHTPTIIVKIGDVVIPADEYTVSYADNKNAGEATVTVTDKTGGSYEFPAKSAPFTINPVEVTFTSASNTWEYDGLSHSDATVTVTSGELVGDEGFEFTVTGVISEIGSVPNAFTFVAKDGTLASNYAITPAVGTLTIGESMVYPIVNDPVTGDPTIKDPESGSMVPLTDPNKGYTIVVNPSDDPLVYNGTAQTPPVEVYINGNKVPETEYDVVYTNNVNAGTGTLTIVDKEGGNHTFVSGSADFVIDPVAVTFTSASNSWTYDGLPHSDATVTVTSGELVGDEGFEFTVTGTITEVGSVNNVFTFTAKEGTLASNYAVTPMVGVLTIENPGIKTIYPIVNDPISGEPSLYNPETGTTSPLDDPNKGYTVVVNPSNDPLVYDGSAQTPPVEIYVNGVKLPETEYDLVYTNNVNAGTGTVSIVDKVGGDYLLIGSDASFSIGPRPLDINWGETQFVYDGTEKVVTSTLTGVVDGDVVNALVTGNAATVVGDYEATVSGVDNSNYTLSAESVNWTIDKANAVMPELTGVAETEFGSNDGHITGLEEGMLIKKEGDNAFVTVVDPDMDLVPGTYVVKKEGDANHNASEEVSVVVPAGVTSYEIDSLVVSDFGYCPETEDAIRYYVKGSGGPVAFRIVYSADAVNAGFESIDFKAITEEGVLPISIPYCDANTYKAKIQFRSANNVDSKFYDVELPVNLSTRYMVDIWSDVISAVNVEERFEAYQWYHNDVKLEGETKPFYCEQNGLTGSYYMEVLTVDNRNLRTCKLYFAKPVEINLSAYPNPTSDFTTVELSYDNGEEHVLNVYNSAGGAVLSAKFRGVKTVINLAYLPSATYDVNVDGMDVKVIKK